MALIEKETFIVILVKDKYINSKFKEIQNQGLKIKQKIEHAIWSEFNIET